MQLSIFIDEYPEEVLLVSSSKKLIFLTLLVKLNLCPAFLLELLLVDGLDFLLSKLWSSELKFSFRLAEKLLLLLLFLEFLTKIGVAGNSVDLKDGLSEGKNT